MHGWLWLARRKTRTPDLTVSKLRQAEMLGAGQLQRRGCRDPGPDRAPQVVLARLRPAEVGERAVAEQLFHAAALLAPASVTARW